MIAIRHLHHTSACHTEIINKVKIIREIRIKIQVNELSKNYDSTYFVEVLIKKH